MSRPDYADERSYGFFHRVFVGSRNGDGSGHKVTWDTSAEGLEPTAVYPNQACAYCGNTAFPIQAGLFRPRQSYTVPDERDYAVTGYACCCKGAMDEREHKARVEEMKERHARELAELAKEGPAPDPAVFKAFAEGLANQMASKAIDGFKRSKDPVKMARELAKQAEVR